METRSEHYRDREEMKGRVGWMSQQGWTLRDLIELPNGDGFIAEFARGQIDEPLAGPPQEGHLRG